MDPLSAFSLAANILQFIDFGYSMISSAAEVHSSVTGTTADNFDLLVTVGRLEEVAGQLKVSAPPSSEHEALHRLSLNCQTLSEELLRILRSLRVDKRGSARQSISVAWRTWRKHGEITSIRSRLDEYRGQILLEINLLLRKDQSLFRSDLQALIGSTEQVQDELQALKTTIIAKASHATNGGIEAVHALHNELLEFCGRVQQANQRHSILKALRFEKMEERFDDVKKEHAETFKWIFENQQDNGEQKNGQRGNDVSAPQTKVPFINWLRSGSGIFHIEGKAGSGKSTLMKFIRKNPRTMESLESWSSEKRLVFGQFFFWKPGTQLQRSLKGLTRALLHSILEQAPELTELTFPELWRNIRHVPWNVPCDIQFTLVDIQDAFVRLIGNDTIYESRRLCFFIDGLDEFDESNGLDSEHQTCYTDLIKIFSTWVRNRPDVKLCVSSRDWNLFKGAFSAHKRLRLQDLTKIDIKVLVQDSLKGHGISFHDGSSADPQFVELVDQIVEKAEGVFLWVALVLKSLRQGLQYKEGLSQNAPQKVGKDAGGAGELP